VKNRITAYEIALSGVAATMATIFLSVGALSSALLFTGYLLAGLSLCLPLVKGGYIGYACAYVSCCLLTLLFCGFAFFFRLLPFIVFFGLHPLFNELQVRKRINGVVAFIVKSLWFCGAMLLVFWLLFDMTTGIAFLDTYFIPILFILGPGVFFLYDKMYFLCRQQVDKVLKRIFKK